MTGMLARLSARMGGLDGAPAGALRPRLSSPFEQGPAAWIADAVELEAEGPAASAAPLPPSRPRPWRSAGDAPLIPPAAAALHQSPPSRASDGEDEDEASPRRSVSAAAQLDAPRLQPPSPSAIPDHGRSPRQPPGAEAEKAAEGRVAVVQEGGAPEAPAPTSEPGPPSPAGARPRRSPVAEPIPTAAPPALPPRLWRLAASPRREAPAEAHGSPGAAERDVHVTIGRVEVRAVTQTERPVPRPERSGPAVTTLDAYLRQRARREA
jgi:hypothetical protein